MCFVIDLRGGIFLHGEKDLVMAMVGDLKEM